MKRITRISPLAGHRLAVEFEDGVTGTVELESQLFGPVFTPLRDDALFSTRVQISCLTTFPALKTLGIARL